MSFNLNCSDVKSQPRLTSLIASGLLAVFGGLTIGYALNVTGIFLVSN